MKYLTFFTNDTYKDRQLATAPPAVTKSTYMAQLLRDIGQSVEIISPSWSKCHAWHHWKASDSTMDNQVKVHQLATFSTPFRWLTPLQWLYSLGQLFFYLIRHTHAGEPVLVYHSYYLSFPVLLAKRIKKFKLILEVEEIYQDIVHLPRAVQKSEWKIIRDAEAYIFSAASIGEIANTTAKPSMVINGSYQSVERMSIVPFSDGKVHCLYSGTFDKAKAGAFLAVDAAEFLPAQYCIHISGLGTEAQVQELQQEIHHIQEKTPCKIVYEGFLDNASYSLLLQKCQIGLNTQTPNQRFSDTCFPSKILVYMANGLQVISAANKAIVASDVGERLTYYRSQTPEAVAQAIQCADPDSGKDNILFVKQLHKQSCTRLQKMLEMLS